MRLFTDCQNLQRPDTIIGKDEVSSSNLDSSSTTAGPSEAEASGGFFCCIAPVHASSRPPAGRDFFVQAPPQLSQCPNAGKPAGMTQWGIDETASSL